MELTNYLNKVKESANVSKKDWQNSIESLVVMIAPTAPHLAEELWHRLVIVVASTIIIGRSGMKRWQKSMKSRWWYRSTANCATPDCPSLHHRRRGKENAQTSEKVQPFLQGKTIVNVIYVPGKLVNIVVK